ncbi:hypothetical protein RHGRI_017932 [Rhododendron griersonianum]|uniref:Uncharacterized protein n=1 Tax=Rhododendron griersonianum TaxID=479676 RepID=A0AAV6JZN7_9ERIC|nr:hypothetical protein RHGRI_017932 [Rhododendron griersonianum]
MIVRSFQCFPEAPRNTETVFGVTQKEKSPTNSRDDDNSNVGIVGRITFNKSPIFIPATMVLLEHQTGLVIGILGFRPAAGNGFGIGEVICSVCGFVFVDILEGPVWQREICDSLIHHMEYESGALALLFVHLSRWSSMV